MKNLTFILLLFNLYFSSDRLAYVAEVSGYVEILSTRYEKYQEVQAINGRFLYENDKIRSYDNGYCIIVFDDQRTLVILSGDTEITLSNKENDIKKINLNYGNVYLEQKNSQSPFFLFTKTSQIRLNDASFFIFSSIDKQDEIISLNNSIDIYNKSSNISLNLKSSNRSISSFEGSINIVENDLSSVPENILKSINSASNLLVEPIFKHKRQTGDLVPDFTPNFSIDVYEKKNKKKYTTEFATFVSHLNNNLYNQILINPKYSSKNFKLDISLNFYNSINEDSPKINSYNNTIKILAKIKKLNYSNSSKNIIFKSGYLNNINLGHGLLIKNYRNLIGYPFKNKFGLSFNYLNEDFLNIKLISSSIDGGFIAAHSSLFVSKFLPIKLGLGFVLEPNVLYDADSKFILPKRSTKSFEIDLTYDLVEQRGYNLNIISEIAALTFPADYFYKRYNSSTDLNGALKSKSGSWGAALGFEGSYSQFINIKTLFHYNDPLFLPSYFNATYETEKFRFLPLKSTYSDNISQIDAMFSSLEQTHLPNNEVLVVVPKDLYQSYNNEEFVYPSMGLSFDLNYNYYNRIVTYLSFCSFFEINNPNSSNSLSSLDIEISVKDKVLKNIKKLDFFYSKNYTDNIANTFEYNENTIIGLNICTKIKYNLLLDLNLERVNYDYDFDSVTDNVDAIEFGVRYEF